MDEQYSMFVLHVGSTSTKLAWHQDSEPVDIETIPYAREDLALYSSVPGPDRGKIRQKPFGPGSCDRLELLEKVRLSGHRGRPAEHR